MRCRERERKQQVLTKGRASAVQSIAMPSSRNGEPFFLCEPDGEVPVDGHHGYGLYHHDCRFLAGYVGKRRWSAAGCARGDGVCRK